MKHFLLCIFPCYLKIVDCFKKKDKESAPNCVFPPVEDDANCNNIFVNIDQKQHT